MITLMERVVQSISKRKQWNSLKIAICSVNHSVVCDRWNLHEYNNNYTI